MMDRREALLLVERLKRRTRDAVRLYVGGSISAYWTRFTTLAAQGGDVEIRGSCELARTLVTSVIAKEWLCFSDHAALRFHKARIPDGSPTIYYTQQMVDSYPADIRGWIVAMGDVENMPADVDRRLADREFLAGHIRSPTSLASVGQAVPSVTVTT